MQLVNIVGPLDAYSETAQAVIKTECFHPENIRNVLRGFSHLLPYEDENPYRPLLVIWSHHPFDIHAKAEHVFIEGKQEC